MTQPASRWFQAFWTALHIQAAMLAQLAVLIHLASAEYHRRRFLENFDQVEMGATETADRADAFVRARRR